MANFIDVAKAQIKSLEKIKADSPSIQVRIIDNLKAVLGYAEKRDILSAYNLFTATAWDWYAALSEYESVVECQCDKSGK